MDINRWFVSQHVRLLFTNDVILLGTIRRYVIRQFLLSTSSVFLLFGQKTAEAVTASTYSSFDKDTDRANMTCRAAGTGCVRWPKGRQDSKSRVTFRVRRLLLDRAGDWLPICWLAKRLVVRWLAGWLAG